jgi:hypothetical protein
MNPTFFVSSPKEEEVVVMAVLVICVTVIFK